MRAWPCETTCRDMNRSLNAEPYSSTAVHGGGITFTSCSRVSLVISNIILAFLGLGVSAIGIYLHVKVDKISATEDIECSRTYRDIFVTVVVVGAFVLILSLLGVVCGICAHTCCGKYILAVYVFSLSIVLLCQLAGVITASVEKTELRALFTDPLGDTFVDYMNISSKRDTWDTFQTEFKCCGLHSCDDYSNIFPEYFVNGSVPTSCCKSEVPAEMCEIVSHQNTGNYTQYVYQEGCVNMVTDLFQYRFRVVVGCFALLGVIELGCILMGCIVALSQRVASKTGYETLH